MSTLYDASYRSGMREGESRTAFLHSEAPYEVSQLSNSDEDDDISCEMDPSDYSPTNVPAVGSGMVYSIGHRAARLATSVVQSGARIFYQQRQCIQAGEGSTLLHLLCFLGGLTLLTSSLLSTVNIFSLLTSPSTYVLQLYQGFFGVVTMIVEARNWECFDNYKPWMSEWFRFLTVPVGKGAFYLFVGSLGVSLWLRNLFSFIVGLYMSFMGILCIAVHAGTSLKPQQYEQDQDFGQAGFHQGGEYDEENEAPLHSMLRPETTTTSSGHSLTSGAKGKNGKIETASMLTLPISRY